VRMSQLAARSVRILAVPLLVVGMAAGVSAVWSTTAAVAQPATTARPEPIAGGIAHRTPMLPASDPALASDGSRHGRAVPGRQDVVPSAVSGSWKVVKSPNPSSTESELYGVSCTAANACEAVGV
jgi:hypothetical protein